MTSATTLATVLMLVANYMAMASKVTSGDVIVIAGFGGEEGFGGLGEFPMGFDGL